MEKQKLIYVESKALFSPSEVSNKAIVFIKDTKEIWTHGTYFICSNIWATPITLTLSGDSTGSVSIDGSGGVTLLVENRFLTGESEITDTNLAVLDSNYKVSYYAKIRNGSSNLFAVTNNANAILTLNTHDYVWNHQLGFSSNKGIYHRTRNGGVWDSSWEKLLTSTNYTKYPHTFASLTNKPTTISGYGITDSIPIIKGGEVTGNTDLSTLGMTTAGYKFSVSCGYESYPSWLMAYTNVLMFRANSDSYGAIGIEMMGDHRVLFMGGRNAETSKNNVPNWWFRIKGNSSVTYDLNSFLNTINNLNSNYLRKSGGIMTGILTLTTDTAYINDTQSGSAIFGTVSTSNTFTGISGLETIFAGRRTNMVLRTSGNNLWHYNYANSARYLILDANNYTTYTINYANSNINTYGSVGVIANGKLYYNNAISFARFVQSDNSGRPSYELIAELPNYGTGTNTSYITYGISGFMWAYRDGNGANSGAYPITAIVNVGPAVLLNMLRVPVTTNVLIPLIVKYDDKYYIALKKLGSSTTFYFMGIKLNLLTTPIIVNDASLIEEIAGPITETSTASKFYNNGNPQAYLHAGNYSNYALPLSGGTLTGTLTSANIVPRTSVTYNIGTTSAYYNNIYALYFKRKDSSDSYVLLGGGGHKLLSDLSSAHTHDWPSITSKPSLLGAMATPIFYPYANDGKLGAYISTINNRFYSADLRYTVTTTNLSGNKHCLFDDNYDLRMLMEPGTTATITIEGYNFIYNNGYIILYFYLYSAYPLLLPKSITAVATNKNGTTYTLNRATSVETQNTIAFLIGLEFLTKLEFTIVSLDNAYCGITNIDYFSRRTENTARDCAVVTKYNANTLYHNLTAPKYIVKNGTSSLFLKADGSLDSSNYYKIGTELPIYRSVHIRDQSTNAGIFGVVNSGSDLVGGLDLATVYSGTSILPYLLRTSADNLYHYNANKSSRYLILDTNNYSSYALPLSGGTMTGAITLTSGSDAANEKNALSFIKKSDKSELARIGTDTANGLGMYAKGNIYIRPNVTLGSSSTNGLVISSSSFTYNGTAVSLVGHTHSYLPLSGGTLGSSTASFTDLFIKSSTAKLRLTSFTDSTTYIQSGNSDFTGNATLRITGYNGNTGSNLYFNFANIYCRGSNYINIDSGNYSSYALPLSGGTMTGTINCKAIVPITDNGYSIGTSSKTLYEIHANFFKRRGSSNDYVLLGGGEHKLISDFVLNYTAVVPGGSVGNNDSWTLILNNNYSTGWYNPCTMFYIRSHNFGCGILCFYHYWDTSLTSGYYDNSVWFFGAEHSAYSGTMGGTGRDINNFLKVYIDKDNDNLKIYYNRYNNLSMYILELLFSLYLAGTLYPKGLIRASHFITNGAVTDLPITSSTFVNIPILTTKNHTEDIKTTRSVYASAFYENSDIRLKENVHSIDLIDLLKNVDLVLFNFKNDLNKKYGVIAQQLEQVGLNNLVYEHNGNKAVDYISLLVLETLRLRNEIKELKEKLDKKELSS